MIRLLDETTVGQIAAGEVVERPLSVVKELVENALDAGARRISVAIVRGGLDAIDVTDDGIGIAPEDLPLAFARHATSKLARASDLERIASLGFRGEGLASIAAIARVRLVSRTAGSDVGFAVDAHGIETGEPEPVAAAPGTRVVVRDLFGNVPVRREYVRTPAAEFARISTFLAALALGYPYVSFALAHDGRPVFAFPGTSALDQRLAHVFGPVPARALVALEPHDGDAPSRVRGYISAPGTDRGDRRMQLLFVNGRLLRSTLLAGSWSSGYASYALAGRQPFGVLFLDVPPEHVDPNVHPTKSDVRLRHPEVVHDLVRRAIATTLARHATSRMLAAVSFAPPAGGAASEPERSVERDVAPSFDWSGSVARLANGYRESPSPPAIAGAPAELTILAQLDETFVLATDGRALVLVDQHAAHERVAFEAIAERAARGAPASEPLLLPYTIELDADEADRFERSREALLAAGLDAEPFGERAYRIVATPAGYGARAFDVRDYIADLGDEIAGLSARERVWASLACHSVARAGERLEHAEMTALLARLVRCENPMHCPHGRPTIVRIEADAIARMFKR
jgi:DNA mismatch repair protein MutL